MLAGAFVPIFADAGCSRVIIIPAAQSGHTVAFKGDEAVGVMPDMFKRLASATGCSFRWSLVPRIRLEAMFESGTADLLLVATESERRDRHGTFVPLVESRATLISLASERPRVSNFDELLARRELRVALVRGYDYGEQYLELIKKLSTQRRVYFEPDPVAVGRLMAHGMADVTIMPPTAFAGALRDDARVSFLLPKLRVEPLGELPWIKTGIYLSNKALSPGDRDILKRALTSAQRSGAWWSTINQFYSKADLADHVRQLCPADGNGCSAR